MPAISGSAEAVGLFIDAWATDVVESFRNLTPVISDMPMTASEMVGGVYHQPVRLSFEAGQTFAPASPPSGTGASITPGNGRIYVGPRAGFVGDAQIRGMQIHGRSQIPYEAIARSASSLGAGISSLSAGDRRKAVRAATKTVAEGLMMGTMKKVEALALHGGEGLGQIEGASTQVSNVVASTYEAGGFAIDVSLSPESWAEALWVAFEGHTLDLFANTSGLPSGSKLNTTANSILTGTSQNGFILIGVNPATPLTGGTATGRVLRLFHSSGTLGAPGTGVLGGVTFSATAANNNQHIVFESAGVGTEWTGLGLIAQNTGTLFNIAGADYSAYQGNLVANVGNLRLATLIRGLARSINKGAQGKKIRAVVPTELFAQFANDESTLRRYAGESASAKNGFSSIEMFLPQGGVLEIVGHGLQKNGRVLCYVPQDTVRVGSDDLKMVDPAGGGSNSLTLHVGNSPSGEIRQFGQFAPFPATPAHMTLFTGVTF
jgi:hypothetical protein